MCGGHDDPTHPDRRHGPTCDWCPAPAVDRRWDRYWRQWMWCCPEHRAAMDAAVDHDDAALAAQEDMVT